MNIRKPIGALAFGAAAWASAVHAEEIKIAVGCPPVAACADWVWAEDLATALKAAGLEAKVFTGGSLGKDPELVDQLSQSLLQFALTNFVMIKQVDPAILGFVAPYMFDDMDHFFRATQEADSDILRSIDENMQAQGVRIAGLTGLGGTMGIFNAKHEVASPADLDDIRLRAIDDSQIELFDQWDASGAVIDMPEFAGAVQQGVVDGYFNPPILPIIFKHTEFLKFFTDLGAGTPFRAALMSNDWYEGLDEETHDKVDAAIDEAMAKNRVWTAKATEMEPGLLTENGVAITKLTPEALADFRERSENVWPVLMPEASIAAFVELAEETRN